MTYKSISGAVCKLEFKLVMITNNYQPLIEENSKEVILETLHTLGKQDEIEILDVKITDKAIVDITFTATLNSNLSRFIENTRKTITEQTTHIDLNGYSFWRNELLLMTVGQRVTDEDKEVISRFVKEYGQEIKFLMTSKSNDKSRNPHFN